MRSDRVPRRVLLLALGPCVPKRVVQYAGHLAGQNLDVILIVVDHECRSGYDIDGRVRIHRLMDPEERTPLRMLEKLLGDRVSGGRVVVLFRQLFALVYRQLRASVLARRARKRLWWKELDEIDAVVAGDIDSVALGFRLARRNPGAIATAALNLELLTDWVSGLGPALPVSETHCEPAGPADGER